jgi:hypothetical protein
MHCILFIDLLAVQHRRKIHVTDKTVYRSSVIKYVWNVYWTEEESKRMQNRRTKLIKTYINGTSSYPCCKV